MRKSFLLTIFLCLFILANAKIRRVGYTDVPPINGTDYSTFYDAYAAAANGDTVYVFPGKTICGGNWPTSYNRAEIHKRLMIVGKGSWLDSASNPKGNFGYQATLGKTYFGAYNTVNFVGIYFSSGSKGSVLTGFDGNGACVQIETDSITLRSNFNFYIFMQNYNIKGTTVEKNYRVWFTGDASRASVWSDITIRNNFIYGLVLPDKSYNGIIQNNTIAFDRSSSNNGGDLTMSYIDQSAFPTHFYNSYISLHSGSWIFKNNLIVYYQSSSLPANSPFLISEGDQTQFKNNVATAAGDFVWPAGVSGSAGNITIQPAQVGNIFKGFPSIDTFSADKRYTLAPNSPANQANRPGSDADAGMYGGLTPYKVSTIPAIPTIYKLDGQVSGNNINITIGTRSNN